MNTESRAREKPIVVLGASGRVGNVVARQLLDKNIPIRAVARHTANLKDLEQRGAEIWTGAIEDQDFLNTVFTNAKAAFILTPGDTASPDLHGEQQNYNLHIVEAIRHSGIGHVVFLSSWGSELPEKSGTIYGCPHMEKLLKIVHVQGFFSKLRAGGLHPAVRNGLSAGAIRTFKRSRIGKTIPSVQQFSFCGCCCWTDKQPFIIWQFI